jgi:hypothetical protein
MSSTARNPGGPRSLPRPLERGSTARREFLAALRIVVAEDNPGPPEQIEAECARLLDHLG